MENTGIAMDYRSETSVCFVRDNNRSGSRETQTDLRNERLALAQPPTAKQDGDAVPGLLSPTTRSDVLSTQSPAIPPPGGRGFLGYCPDPIHLPSSEKLLTTPGLPHPSRRDPCPGVASIHLARHPSASIPGCKGNIYKSHFQTGYTFVQRSRWVGVVACHLRYLYGEEVGAGMLRDGAEGLQEEDFQGCSDLIRLRLPCPQSLP